ncbi:MAG: mannose-1-phosphate guanylyltransferase [Bacteroidetes bacterium GWA2_31_9]|nr:MAG: mannose-1-phosphate guanylyltransferase [Bacteroidetes bacterium GWA2_31_9]
MHTDNYCVIMAGGVGSRFWPVSRTLMPKQFLDILGTGKTLLQETFDRFKPLIPAENFYIVTSFEYQEIVLSQLPEITAEQVLLEPMRRNTAPCIAFANHKIFQKNPNANIVVTPADHLIIKVEEFLRVIEQGLGFASSCESLLTLGIKPTRPDTGYGYIQFNSDLEISKDLPNLKKVKTFTEKPELDIAKFFLESGEFYWNSGIFIWSVNSINAAFERYLTDVSNLFKDKYATMSAKSEESIIHAIYTECQNISIDYGIMEKASNVYVLCSDFGWSDLGTWNSVYEHSAKDEKGNAIKNDTVLLYNSKNNIVKANKDKLVVVHGLTNYIVVDTSDVLLICKKDEEQLVRQFVNDAKLLKGEQYI